MTKNRFLLYLACLLASAATLSATSIPITNPSFESPTVTGTFIVGDVTGWTGTAGCGGCNWGVLVRYSSVFPPPVDGLQEAFINGAGSLDQVLGTDLAANTTYTLTVYVGQRTDYPLQPYDVQLKAGGVLLADNGSPDPAPGTFAPVVVTFATGSTGPQIGDPLEIDLISLSPPSLGGVGAQVWDDVSLNATTAVPTPEPGSIVLLGTSLLGLMGLFRRMCESG